MAPKNKNIVNAIFLMQQMYTCILLQIGICAEWQGNDLNGKTIFVKASLGDSISAHFY
jgi:hypothetical protein